MWCKKKSPVCKQQAKRNGGEDRETVIWTVKSLARHCMKLRDLKSRNKCPCSGEFPLHAPSVISWCKSICIVPTAYGGYFTSVCDSSAKTHSRVPQVGENNQTLLLSSSCATSKLLLTYPLVLPSLRMQNVFLSMFCRLPCLLQVKNGFNLLCEHGIGTLVLFQCLMKCISYLPCKQYHNKY